MSTSSHHLQSISTVLDDVMESQGINNISSFERKRRGDEADKENRPYNSSQPLKALNYAKGSHFESSRGSSTGAPIQVLKPKMIKLHSKPQLHLSTGEGLQHHIPLTTKNSTPSIRAVSNSSKPQSKNVPISAYLT